MEKEIKNIERLKGLSRDQFEILFNIAKRLNSVSYEETLIEDVLDFIISATNAERCVFVKYIHSTGNFTIISARNVKKETIWNLKEFSSGVLQQVTEKKEPVIYHDVKGDPNVSQFESIKIQRIKSIMGVPIIYDAEIWGVILADSKKDRTKFTESNLLFLNFFANLVSLALDKIISLENLRDENQLLLSQLDSTDELPAVVGKSRQMREIGKIIRKVARTDATVLITGESGTGKDLTAQAIHKLSARKDHPFITQFCGSIPESLLESELFGYKKGAFTGANNDKKGLFEVADKGTFFLDEIADISSAVQSKLLRVIENKEIIRLGDTKVRKVDVRILAATNKDLQKLVNEGKFREDLYYRLNVFPIKLPPLRERISDLPLLAKHFLKQIDDRDMHLHAKALRKLENYYWPGNVRQLLNVLQRASILCDSNKILEEHIIWQDSDDAENYRGTLKDFEQIILSNRLREFKGNKTQTAKSLGVSVRWIQMKLKELGEE